MFREAIGKNIITVLMIIFFLISKMYIEIYAEECQIDDYGISISIPDDFIVLTRDMEKNDVYLDILGIDKEEFSASMAENKVFIDAVNIDRIKEIVISVMDYQNSKDVNSWNDTEIAMALSTLQYVPEGIATNEIEPRKTELYQNELTKFFKVYFTEVVENEKMYSLQYFTIYAGKKITIQYNSLKEEINDDNEKIMQDIVDSMAVQDTDEFNRVNEKVNGFQYIDRGSGILFDVPEGWIEAPVLDKGETNKAKFVHQKGGLLAIIYGCRDMWGFLSQNEKNSIKRSDIDNSYALKFGLDDAEKVSYGENEFFKVDAKEVDMDFPLAEQTIMLCCINNGYTYYFSFQASDDNMEYYEDFEKILQSVQFTVNVSEGTEETSPISTSAETSLDVSEKAELEEKVTRSNADEIRNGSENDSRTRNVKIALIIVVSCAIIATVLVFIGLKYNLSNPSIKCDDTVKDKQELKEKPTNLNNHNLDNLNSYYLPEGIMLGSRYIINKVIGEGGFGITYRGHDTRLNIPVAIKEYYPKGFVQRSVSHSLAVSITAGEEGNIYAKGKFRFLNEAQIIAKFISEPGIVKVTDYFEENGTAYIIMEYLNGITMKDYLKKVGRFSSNQIFSLMMPLMKSLDLVHKSGLIHRDISPDNIMLMPNGRLKLLDFGASKDYSMAGQKSMTIILKRGYAPEEQYRSRGFQGPWTDVYALCATIYTCITGIVPDESIQRRAQDNMRWPSELGIEILPIQEQALKKGMSVFAKERFQSMKELALFLNQARRKL